MTVVETQWDAVIGPTHHYAGLSQGNIASELHAHSVSCPKQAALQGLDKMKLVASLGVPQYILPPQPRPNLAMLEQLGFVGMLKEQLQAVSEQNVKMLSAVYSAASMWSANMATFVPAWDSASGRPQFTPANLLSTLHRPQEAAWNYQLLRALWGDAAQIHPPLPASWVMADEGAANHMRLCAQHSDVGVHVFVYGRASDMSAEALPKHYPSRQTREACEGLARLHGVHAGRAVYVQQHPDAIDAGVFHNDVIAMSNQNILIYHEKAYVETEAFLARLRHALAPTELVAIEIKEKDLSLRDAVSSYFFNSQFLSLPNNQGMAIIAPKECEQNHAAFSVLSALVVDTSNPITQLHFPDVRESMKNGGGPACLRLRVVGEDKAFPVNVQALKWTEVLDAQVRDVVYQHYRDTLSVEDLCDAAFAEEALTAHAALMKVLHLPKI